MMRYSHLITHIELPIPKYSPGDSVMEASLIVYYGRHNSRMEQIMGMLPNELLLYCVVYQLSKVCGTMPASSNGPL